MSKWKRTKGQITINKTTHRNIRYCFYYEFDERKPFTDHICGYRQLVGVICICSMDVNWLITDNISLSSWLTFFSINSYSHSDDMFIIIKSNINTDASIGFDICINYHPVKFHTTVINEKRTARLKSYIDIFISVVSKLTAMWNFKVLRAWCIAYKYWQDRWYYCYALISSAVEHRGFHLRSS